MIRSSSLLTPLVIGGITGLIVAGLLMMRDPANPYPLSALALTGFGVLLQGYGFHLAIADVRRVEKAIKDYAGAGRSVYAGAAFGGEVTAFAPRIDQRVGGFEQAVGRIEASIAEARREAVEQASQRLLRNVPGQGRVSIAFFMAGLFASTLGALLAF